MTASKRFSNSTDLDSEVDGLLKLEYNLVDCKKNAELWERLGSALYMVVHQCFHLVRSSTNQKREFK